MDTRHIQICHISYLVRHLDRHVLRDVERNDSNESPSDFSFLPRCHPSRPVKFGARLGVLPTVQVQIGINPHNGQPIYQSQPMAPNGYVHWALQSSWQWGANCIQGVIFILFLSAMSTDSWSESGGSFSSISWGVVRYHGDVADTYQNLCSGYNGEDATACGTLRAAGAFTLLWSLITIITMLFIIAQSVALSCCQQSASWHEYQYKIALFQAWQLGYIVLLWAWAGHVDVRSIVSNTVLGASWGLTLTCWICSWFMVLYYKAAIEYRRNGDPIRLQVPVTQVILVQHAGGPVIMQQQPMIHVQQQQPVMMHPPPPQQQQWVGQPQQMQPQQMQHQYPQPTMHQQQPQGGYMQPQQSSYPPQSYPPQGQQQYVNPNAPPPAYTEQPEGQQTLVHQGAQPHQPAVYQPIPQSSATSSSSSSPSNQQIPVTFPDVSKGGPR